MDLVPEKKWPGAGPGGLGRRVDYRRRRDDDALRPTSSGTGMLIPAPSARKAGSSTLASPAGSPSASPSPARRSPLQDIVHSGPGLLGKPSAAFEETGGFPGHVGCRRCSIGWPHHRLGFTHSLQNVGLGDPAEVVVNRRCPSGLDGRSRSNGQARRHERSRLSGAGTAETTLSGARRYARTALAGWRRPSSSGNSEHRVGSAAGLAPASFRCSISFASSVAQPVGRPKGGLCG